MGLSDRGRRSRRDGARSRRRSTWCAIAAPQIGDVALPHSVHAIPVYYIIATAEASSNLARYDGVRYGFRDADARTLAEMYERTRGAGFGREVKRRIILGTYVLSAGYYDAYYLKAQQVRTLIRRDYDAAFAGVDVIAMPTSPTAAFPLGERIEDPVQMYLSDVFTVGANLAGLPAITVPCGFTADRLPIGLQFTGRALGDADGAAGRGRLRARHIMVERTPGDGSLVDFALTRAPDLPRWVDTRGMLLSGRAEVFAPAGATRGATPRARSSSSATPRSRRSPAVRRPTPSRRSSPRCRATSTCWRRWRTPTTSRARSTAGGAAPRSSTCSRADALGAGGRSAGARVHAAECAAIQSRAGGAAARAARRAEGADASRASCPASSRSHVRFVGGVTVPMAAVWADGRPVAFCYPVWQTETQWDVSIDTLAPYRRRGLGARAARTLIRHMRGMGRAPVWGALESNSASRALAARLGFLEAGGIAVFTAR